MSGLVIFDCDGVLVDTEVIACRVIAEVLTGAGFPVLEAEMRAFVGMSGPAAYQAIAERFGRAVPDDVQTKVRAEFRACMSDGLAPMPGVVDVLDALTAPYCVGSNSSHPHIETALATAGLAERFHGRVFSSADVARPKPHPDLFLHAASVLGADPLRSVVVEDSVHGVAAGKAAGMRVLGFTGGGHCGADHAVTLAAAGADAVCADMTEIARHMVDGGWARRA